MKLITCTFLLIILMSGSVVPQSRNNRDAVKRIETYLSAMEKVGFTGAVLVELPGQKVFSKGYGYRDAEQRLKNTPDTIFDIGSITKQFTGAAIMKLEMQGRLSTNDKITKYFAGVPADKADITIHQLLRHSAGLPSVVGGDYDRISAAEFVDKVMKAPLKFPSGTNFSYSNVGYSLLGMIIEKVSGLTYEQYLYQNLWQPAAMESTGYSRPHFDRGLIAMGYKDEKAWGKPIDREWDKDAPFWHLKGNGGILSTTGDLYKWNLALLSDKILSKEAKQKYYHPTLRPNESPNPFYAYGWDMFKTKRNTFLARHNGTNRVFYSDFYRYLDEGITIIFLSNKEHPNFRETDLEISRLIFNPGYSPIIPTVENETNREFTNRVMATILEQGFESGIEVYQKRNRNENLIERFVNDKGYELLGDKKVQESISLFRLNVFAFPRSANAYDSLGESYLDAGNQALAIDNYRKSLELNPDNRNAEQVLKRLANK